LAAIAGVTLHHNIDDSDSDEYDDDDDGSWRLWLLLLLPPSIIVVEAAERLAMTIASWTLLRAEWSPSSSSERTGLFVALLLALLLEIQLRRG
jgi:hypothetical protein